MLECLSKNVCRIIFMTMTESHCDVLLCLPKNVSGILVIINCLWGNVCVSVFFVCCFWENVCVILWQNARVRTLNLLCNFTDGLLVRERMIMIEGLWENRCNIMFVKDWCDSYLRSWSLVFLYLIIANKLTRGVYAKLVCCLSVLFCRIVCNLLTINQLWKTLDCNQFKM